MIGLHNLQAHPHNIPKHKVFVSFHHLDENYRNEFETKYSEQADGFVCRSVQDGDINPYIATDTIRQQIRDNFIADSTVTIVLIGEGTWRRKHVDWEIASSIRDTKNNSRNGLIGILLPTYQARNVFGLAPINYQIAEDGALYNPYTIPPRLYDNVKCDFAKLYSWESLSKENLKYWIHQAFLRRDSVLPTNAYQSFNENEPESKSQWSSFLNLHPTNSIIKTFW